MNVLRLGIVRDFLVNHPDRFHYGTYCGLTNDDGFEHDTGMLGNVVENLNSNEFHGECGTVGCVAGWTVAIGQKAGWHVDGKLAKVHIEYIPVSVDKLAAKYLELTELQADSLFTSTNWCVGDNGFDIAIEKLEELINPVK